MGVAAVVLRHQDISGVRRKPGDLLTLEEYSGIALHVRDAMESNLDIKKIFDEEAAQIFESLEKRVSELEQKLSELVGS